MDAPGTADNGSYLSVYGPFPATSRDRRNFVGADGTPSYSGAFYQTIAGPVVGESYALTFYQAAGQHAGFNGPTTEQWDVAFGGVTQDSSEFQLAHGGVGDWELQTMTFTANATSPVLSFPAYGTPDGEPPISFLDGVDLQPTSAPKPARPSLMVVGLVDLGATPVALARRAHHGGLTTLSADAAGREGPPGLLAG